jgi:hypothetical protein
LNFFEQRNIQILIFPQRTIIEILTLQSPSNNFVYL